MNTAPHDDELWYERAFDAVYREVYPHRSDAQAAAEVDFVSRKLAPLGEHPILDLCCGHGRHSARYSALGHRVVGIDLSFDLIRAARKRDLDHALFIRADMRRLPFRGAAFGLVTSFFTSFGYFSDPREDLAVLREIARVLRPDGSFVLDFLNAEHVRATLVPESHRVSGDWLVHERRRIDEGRRRVVKDVVLKAKNGQEKRYHESVRLYEARELRELAVEAGLDITEILGDLTGAHHAPDSDRCVIVGARRP